jgi:hypothetical protein
VTNIALVSLLTFEYIEIWLKDSWSTGAVTIIYLIGFLSTGSVTNTEGRKWSNIGVWGLLNLFAFLHFGLAFIASKWIQMKYMAKKEALYKAFLDAQAALKARRSQKQSVAKDDEESAKQQAIDFISIDGNIESKAMRGLNKIFPDPNKKSYGPITPIKLPGQKPYRGQVMPMVQFGPMELESSPAKDIGNNSLLLSGRGRQTDKSLDSYKNDKNVSQWELQGDNLNRIVSQNGVSSGYDSDLEGPTPGLSPGMEIKIQNQMKMATGTGLRLVVESPREGRAKTRETEDEEMRNGDPNKVREKTTEEYGANVSPSKVRGILKHRVTNWNLEPDKVIVSEKTGGSPIGKPLKVSKKVDLEGTLEGTVEDQSGTGENTDKDKVDGHSIVKKEIGSRNSK